MCLGELGRVLSVDGDVALVRSDRGSVTASLLLAPGAAVGDDVVVHSGHVLSVVGRAAAATALALRAGPDAAAVPGPIETHDRQPREVDPWTPRTGEASSSRR